MEKKLMEIHNLALKKANEYKRIDTQIKYYKKERNRLLEENKYWEKLSDKLVEIMKQ
jgi:hypothetical protein